MTENNPDGTPEQGPEAVTEPISATQGGSAGSPPTAPEFVPTVVEEWNPLATTETTEIAVPSSAPAGPDGEARAFLLVKPWSGRERLTYEDQLLSRFLLPGKAEDGQEPEDVPDVVKLATMRLVATSLTLQGSRGFPARPDGSTMFSGGDKRRVEAELLALTQPVYAEVRDLCLDYQPMPRAQLDEEKPGDGSEAGDADPFQTPPTPATADPSLDTE